MRAVPMGVIDTNFHGPLQFYAYEDVTQEWWCYEAKFTDGQCDYISYLEYERRDGPYAMPLIGRQIFSCLPHAMPELRFVVPHRSPVLLGINLRGEVFVARPAMRGWM
jgi:hypothetical protein